MGEKKTIFILKDENENNIVNQQQILEQIYSFYQKLYKEEYNVAQSITIENFLDSIETPSLNEDDKVFLDKSISKQELYSNCSFH